MIESNPYDDDPASDPAAFDEDDAWRHPRTLGLAALVLAVLALFDVGAMRGSSYTLLLQHNGLDPAPPRHLLIAGAFLTAALALLPVALARLGLRRLVADDGPWAGHVLRAAMLLGGIAVVLDLVRGLLALANHDLTSIQVLL